MGSNPIWDSDFFRVYVSPRFCIVSCFFFSVKNIDSGNGNGNGDANRNANVNVNIKLPSWRPVYVHYFNFSFEIIDYRR